MADFRISIENRIAEMGRLMEAAQGFLAERGLGDDAVFSVQLALDEMVTNLIRYGYEDATVLHAIDISIRLEQDQAVVLIEDDARPFDPTSAPTPDTSGPLSQRPIGGLGIHLVRHVVEDMRYQRVGERNRLELRISTRAFADAPPEQEP